MSNQNVKFKIFTSIKKQRNYDRQDEKQIFDVIQKDVLSISKAKYYGVNVKVKRTSDGSAESLVAYMLRSDTYTADIKKIEVDKNFKVKSIQDDYDDTEDIDEEDFNLTNEIAEYQSVDFVIATPVPEIPSAKKAVETIHEQATNAGFTSKMLIGQEARVSNYQRYLSTGLHGFVNIGHGSPRGIILDDGVLHANWFQDLSNNVLSQTVIYFNSCQVFNPPLQTAIMNANARTFIGGIVNLQIGPSEEVCKCFWKKAFTGGYGMESSVHNCESDNYPRQNSHGFSGDSGAFNTGEIIVFDHINFRGHHRHIFGMEKNLNHPEDKSLNDRISSFVVVSGVWRLYRHANFISQLGGEFGPGRYKWVGDVGVMNDQVSSMKCIRS